MQIVIDIDENVYARLFDNGTDFYETDDILAIAKAIRKGTPLPKGHGRLKDFDKIISDGISKGFCDWYDEMKYADTIIEADKVESEEKE